MPSHKDFGTLSLLLSVILYILLSCVRQCSVLMTLVVELLA